MEPSRWQIIKSAVQEALEQPAPLRDEWLLAACQGDPQLIAEVRRLLAAVSEIRSFLTRTDLPSRQRRQTPASTERHDRAGEIVGHYRLERRVGTGGMGDVYVAQDLALGREAAIKLVREPDTSVRVQLLNEAEATARLQHPAIATFYESGEVNGEAFIAMEFVHGPTLRARLDEGPLPAAEALAIARCLLAALTHAHGTGLIHRDIKPENIILTSADAAKLLDFGIAKPVTNLNPELQPSFAPSDHVNDYLIGTPAYLAPEQLLGEPVDERTDIFQVGAVLYEMLTGKSAFHSTSILAQLATLLIDGPPGCTFDAADVPPALSSVLARALARQPWNRYPNAAAFLRAIQNVAGDSATPGIDETIAVDDFENTSGDFEINWVATSVSEALRAAFSRTIPNQMVCRERIVEMRTHLINSGKVADAGTVALHLGCRLCVTGTVQYRGSDLDLTVRVTDVATRRTIVVHRATTQIDGLLKAQQDLLRRTMTSLGISADGTPALDGTIEAQKCYARACALRDSLAKGSLNEAQCLLERTVTIDPGHTDALAALASTYALSAIATSNVKDIEMALVFAQRALAIDPTHATAHTWLGYALMRRGQWIEAEQALRRATTLNPKHSQAYYFCGIALWVRGLHHEALTFAQQAVRLDPAYGMWWLSLGSIHMSLGNLEGAEYSFRRAKALEAVEMRHSTAGAAGFVGEVLRRKGRLHDARREALAAIETVERSDHAYRDAFRAYAFLVLGWTARDERDTRAAEAAFSQVIAQLRGRPQTRCSGHFVVQALAGLAQITRDISAYKRARWLFETKQGYNFDLFFGMTDDDTLNELLQAATAINRRRSTTQHT